MARREITPIADIGRRAPEAGRIRLGIKSGKAMKSIETLRFTSQYRDALEAIAHDYGGRVSPWNDPKARVKNQFEVITETNEIDVLLPKNGLSQYYELWSAGGCQRRCDGISVELVEMHGSEAVPVSEPCICARQDRMECRPYTRINVVLPNVAFAGTWRLETKGWNAAAELPGMFQMVQQLDDAGALVQAVLGVEQRSDVAGGRTRNFVVPKLRLRQSPAEIQAGGARAGALTSGSAHQLEAGAQYELDPAEDIVEGEIVSDEEMQLRDLLADDAAEHNIDPARFVAAISAIDGGILEHGPRVHADIQAGKIKPTGFTSEGAVSWRRAT